MTNLAILVPVLDRPQRVATLIADIRAATPPVFRIVFVATQGDQNEIDEIARNSAADVALVTVPPSREGYGRKLNDGMRATDETYLFLAADDLHFHPGWYDTCLAVQTRTGCCVVGTNDLGNTRVKQGFHSTHSLVHRGYAECGTVDQPGLLVSESYAHQWVDDEFVQTAMWRGTYQHAHQAHVEHLHPDWGKGREDATYLRGRASIQQDMATYNARKHLWGR